MVYFKLFWVFFGIGCLSFGGGYVMLPLIDHQVTHQGWMTTDEFTNVVAISGMMPGSIGLNAAIFVGYQTEGVLGSFVAAFGMVLPSFIFIIIIAKLFIGFEDNKIVNQAFYGLRPVIVGLIFFAAIKFTFSLEVVSAINRQVFTFLLLFIMSLVLLIIRKTHPIYVILLSGLGGVIFYY